MMIFLLSSYLLFVGVLVGADSIGVWLSSAAMSYLRYWRSITLPFIMEPNYTMLDIDISY